MVTNANLNRCYEELSKANTHLRTTSLEKIAAQKAKIATLNAKTVGNKTSRTTKHANPKETPKPSPRFIKKPVAPLLKKPNVNVPLSTRIKSATRASKPASKRNAWIYKKLLAKSSKGEKVEEHIRNLNKNNRVDSHVKHSVPVKKLNDVCGACHECLISSNHDNCLVYSVKFVNCKQPKAITNVRTTKKVWRPKDTGTYYKAYRTYLSVSSSTKIPMLSKFVAVTLGMEIQIVLWYLDSGCSRHITGDRSKLYNYVEKFIGTMRFRNDQFAKIVGYGDYKLGDTII
nr:integrase, catalytic region, zinc finger, CCHC-type, peptidase aspartic, catalytic [Tanacetum cinerariifolium]